MPLAKKLRFKKDQISIGPVRRNLEKMRQKWILEALFSEVYMKIEVFSGLKHNSTSAPIAQLAERLTFFTETRLD